MYVNSVALETIRIPRPIRSIYLTKIQLQQAMWKLPFNFHFFYFFFWTFCLVQEKKRKICIQKWGNLVVLRNTSLYFSESEAAAIDMSH